MTILVIALAILFVWLVLAAVCAPILTKRDRDQNGGGPNLPTSLTSLYARQPARLTGLKALGDPLLLVDVTVHPRPRLSGHNPKGK